MTNQKLATSNLNLRAPKFGQKEGEIAQIAVAVTTETMDGAGDLAGDLMEDQIIGFSALTAVPVCILSTWLLLNFSAWPCLAVA